MQWCRWSWCCSMAGKAAYTISIPRKALIRVLAAPLLFPFPGYGLGKVTEKNLGIWDPTIHMGYTDEVPGPVPTIATVRGVN